MNTRTVPRSGMVGVRLSDIPIAIRRSAGQRVLDAVVREMDGDFELALDVAAALSRAVEDPSDTLYMVSRAAYEDEVARW